MKNSKKKISHLLGLGLDNDDGHKRLTQAEQFSILGGSEETHDKMTESVVKTFEDLKNSGKSLDDVETKELSYLLEKNTPNS